MKELFVTLGCILFVISSISGQDKKPLSPPMTLDVEIDNVSVLIEYNAPSKRSRDIWGGLVPYDKVWRTGANEATRITFSEDVLVEGKMVAKGTYSLFTLPTKENCTIIINEVAKQWGAYGYSQKQDVIRADVEPMQIEEEVEQMTFEKRGNAILLKWDDMAIPFTIAVK